MRRYNLSKRLQTVEAKNILYTRDSVMFGGVSLVKGWPRSTITLYIVAQTQYITNTEKEEHKGRNEGVKKFNTKFRGHNLQIPPEAEITEG